MRTPSLDPHELYLLIGQAIASTPANLLDATRENQMWVARVLALIEATGDPLDSTQMRDAAVNYARHANIYGESISAYLQRALARAELAAPAGARASFIAAGSPMDALNAISKVMKGVSQSVLIVDPYLDEVILTDFAPLIPEGVQIRLLTDDATLKASLEPTVRRWAAQYGSTRPIEARKTAPRLLHDRLVIGDDATTWLVSQSFKDLAVRSSATIMLASPEIASLKVAAYQAIWQQASPI